MTHLQQQASAIPGATLAASAAVLHVRSRETQCQAAPKHLGYSHTGRVHVAHGYQKTKLSVHQQDDHIKIKEKTRDGWHCAAVRKLLGVLQHADAMSHFTYAEQGKRFALL